MVHSKLYCLFSVSIHFCLTVCAVILSDNLDLAVQFPKKAAINFGHLAHSLRKHKDKSPKMLFTHTMDLPVYLQTSESNLAQHLDLKSLKKFIHRKYYRYM